MVPFLPAGHTIFIFDKMLSDLQLISVVEDEGFRRLIHAPLSKYEIPGRNSFEKSCC